MQLGCNPLLQGRVVWRLGSERTTFGHLHLRLLNCFELRYFAFMVHICCNFQACLKKIKILRKVSSSMTGWPRARIGPEVQFLRSGDYVLKFYYLFHGKHCFLFRRNVRHWALMIKASSKSIMVLSFQKARCKGGGKALSSQNYSYWYGKAGALRWCES